MWCASRVPANRERILHSSQLTGPSSRRPPGATRGRVIAAMVGGGVARRQRRRRGERDGAVVACAARRRSRGGSRRGVREGSVSGGQRGENIRWNEIAPRV